MSIISWIMVQSDIANDLILFIGQLDLYFMVHCFCLVSPSNRDSQAPIRHALLSSDNSCFHYCLQYKFGYLIMERICSHWSKFIPLRVDPIFGRLLPPGKQTGSHENCLPLKTWQKKIEVYPNTLTLQLYQKPHEIFFCENVTKYHQDWL